eukprot:maker-scaffold_11-snap-gene-10.13-mRNA-1 protein AED:0.00 eAED:0.00 QI:106/1/1/1/0.5/0.33/3/277/334
MKEKNDTNPWDTVSVSSVSASEASLRNAYHGENEKVLGEYVEKLKEEELNCLVAHRGFHLPSDDMERPLENTLRAFDAAWRKGVKICECDVHCTFDGDLVVCHDESFSRLIGKEDLPLRDRLSEQVRMTYLKNGENVLFLETLLNIMIGNPNRKLVIEVKESNVDFLVKGMKKLIADEDYKTLFTNSQIPVMMSFDLHIIRSLREFRDSLDENSKLAFSNLFLLTECQGDSIQGLYNAQEPVQVNISNIEDITKLEVLLLGLDGVYFDFAKELISSPKVEKILNHLKQKVKLGVFFQKIEDETYSNFKSLRKKGFEFINTDFPPASFYFCQSEN